MRSVDDQDKLSVWDRPVRVGPPWASRTVVVTFEAARRVVMMQGQHGVLVVERDVPWLTADWLWDGTQVTPLDAPPMPSVACDPVALLFS